MLFEVIHSEGRIVMHTEYAECVPEYDILENMSVSGYKFKVDGKLISKTKVLDAVKASNTSTPKHATQEHETTPNTNTTPATKNEPAPVTEPKTELKTEPKASTAVKQKTEMKSKAAADSIVKSDTVTKVATSNSSKPKPKKLFDLDSILGIK